MYNVPSNKMVVDSIHVSDFIEYIFENSDKYNLNGITKEYFLSICNKDMNKAKSIVNGILLENNKNVSEKSILEGIEVFKESLFEDE